MTQNIWFQAASFSEVVYRETLLGFKILCEDRGLDWARDKQRCYNIIVSTGPMYGNMQFNRQGPSQSAAQDAAHYAALRIDAMAKVIALPLFSAQVDAPWALVKGPILERVAATFAEHGITDELPKLRNQWERGRLFEVEWIYTVHAPNSPYTQPVMPIVGARGRGTRLVETLTHARVAVNLGHVTPGAQL